MRLRTRPPLLTYLLLQCVLRFEQHHLRRHVECFLASCLRKGRRRWGACFSCFPIFIGFCSVVGAESLSSTMGLPNSLSRMDLFSNLSSNFIGVCMWAEATVANSDETKVGKAGEARPSPTGPVVAFLSLHRGLLRSHPTPVERPSYPSSTSS